MKYRPVMTDFDRLPNNVPNKYEQRRPVTASIERTLDHSLGRGFRSLPEDIR